MNQILDYGGGSNDNIGKSNKNNNFGGGYKEPKGGGSKLPISDKIVKVFALVMVILAIGLIISGVTSILNNKKESDTQQKNTSTTDTKVEAEIAAELDEISGKVIITVDSPVTISKVKYSWDKEHENVVAGEKQTHLEIEAVSSYGVHVLHVQVIDEQNNKTTKDFTFDSPTGIDKTQPEIILKTVGNKLRVTVTDDTSIGYVTYKWTDEAGNESETVTMTPDEEGTAEYEFEIDIPEGKNTVVVFAIDGSESANVRTASKVIEAFKIPEIAYGWNDVTGILQIQCKHEHGIKSIKYIFNGVESNWDVPEGEVWPDALFEVQSEPGHNEIEIVVTSVDDTEATWSTPWEFNPPEEQPADEEGGEEVPEEEILGSDETEYQDGEEDTNN